MNKTELMDLVIELNNLNKELKKSPDELIGNDFEKFEKMQEIKNKVLTYYGLPDVTEYNQVFEIDGEMPEMRTEFILVKLAKMAKLYHTKPVKTKFETIKEAIEKKSDPSDFLGEIGFKHHSYFRFLYYQLLIAEKITIDEFINECLEVDNMDLYNKLGKIELKQKYTDKDLLKITELVKEYDLKYVWNLVEFNLKKNAKMKLNFDKFWKKIDNCKKLMDSDNPDSIKY